MKMSSSFTFIEILISVTLLTLLATALLSLNISNKQILNLSIDRKHSSMLSTLIFSRYDSNLKNKKKDFYSLVKDDYIIDNNRIKDYLKTKKVSIKESEDSKIILENQSNLSILLYKISMTVYYCKPHVSHFAYYIVRAHILMGNCKKNDLEVGCWC